jgi:capsid protein
MAVNARYDAAQTTVHNQKHWALADGLSVHEATNPHVRRTLRNRARYEVLEANSYAKGIVRTYANDTIGTGPRLQIRTGNIKVDAWLESEFYKWSRRVKLARKLHTIKMSKVIDGEGFGLLVTNPKVKHAVKLALNPLPAEQVTSPDYSYDMTDDNSVDGIHFDEYDNPVRYDVVKDNVLSSSSVNSTLDYESVPARYVVHLFDEERSQQKRGICEIATALPLFAHLRRYSLAVISAAETAADLAGVATSTGPHVNPDEDVEPMDIIDIERNMLLFLPEGYDMRQFKPEQPVTNYSMFKDAIINEIARCLNMPFNIAAGNSSDYNYASGRMDHQTYFKSLRIETNRVEESAMEPVLDEWLIEASMAWDEDPYWSSTAPDEIRGDIATFFANYESLDQLEDYTWYWDGTEHVDPQKAANAQKTKLENKTTTYKAEYAKENKDWRVELMQYAEEQKFIRDNNINTEGVMDHGKPSTETDAPEESEDEENEDQEE